MEVTPTVFSCSPPCPPRVRPPTFQSSVDCQSVITSVGAEQPGTNHIAEREREKERELNRNASSLHDLFGEKERKKEKENLSDQLLRGPVTLQTTTEQ